MIVGNVLSALVGLLVFRLFGQTAWWTLAVAIGVAMALMVVTNTFHPPAAVTDFFWVFAPVGVGVVIVVLIGILYSNLFAGQQYPIFWC